MKYVVVLCDGMADYPVAQLNGKTPMMVAKKNNMDFLAQNGEVGLVKTVAEGLTPGSDVANLSVMGYNPKVSYTGRSPLEAVSMGIDLADTDVTVRCNLVTLSDNEPFEHKRMIDYCADDISTEDAKILIEYVQEHLGNEIFSFHAGVSYRHCVVWKNGVLDLGELTAPHDITGQIVTEHLPKSEEAAVLLDLMKKANALLINHPLNKERIAKGSRPANGIWLWGQGSKPLLENFEEKNHLKGSVVSAVDLIKGIGICAGMTSRDVSGATGYLNTNFEGKVQAALNELEAGQDFVYIHLEAPDECGHRREIENKVKSIEYIDERIIKTLLSELPKFGDYAIMILPDHPTPVEMGKHVADPVPYLIYYSNKQQNGVSSFTEETAKGTGTFVEEGYTLMNRFLSVK